MDIQDIIVYLIVVAAVVYTVRRLLAFFRRKGRGGCGCGCPNCCSSPKEVKEEKK